MNRDEGAYKLAHVYDDLLLSDTKKGAWMGYFTVITPPVSDSLTMSVDVYGRNMSRLEGMKDIYIKNS